MTGMLKILLVEDSEDDAVLLLRKLDKESIPYKSFRVETREGLVSALETTDWDIVISDYLMPGFSGMEALNLVKQKKPELPFIMISGKMDEEVVVESLKAGAQDYVMKDKFYRLGPSVRTALKSREAYEEKVEAERELRKVVSRYHLLADNITDIIWTMDRYRKFTFVSPSITEILGYRIEEVLGRKLDGLLSPRDFRKVDEVMKRALNPGEKREKKEIIDENPFEMEVHSKKGREIWMETKVAILTGKRGRPSGILGISRDISERKRRDKEIALLALAFKQIGEGVVITDKEGIILYVNDSFKKASGFPPAKWMGKSAAGLDCGSDGGSPKQDFRAALRKGKSWKGRLRRIKKNGSFYQVDASLSPMNDEDGNIINFVYIERDVTQDLKLQDKFVEMQKMEALGTLAGGIAHDFNNILMPVIVNTELLLWDYDKDDPQSAYLNQILEAAQRGKDLVKQIISFSRKSSVEKKNIDLAPLIKDSLSFLHASLPSTIEIDPEIEIEDSRIKGNSTQIHQVMMNLCANAADALGDKGGRIKINLGRETFEDRKMSPDSRLKSGSYMRISVSDSGPGIDPDIRKNIFDPFFSTKEPGKGSGMGLAVARRIVHDHGGTIILDEGKEGGAVFHVYLPASDGRIPLEEKKKASLDRGNERIFLIDDEDWVVDSLRRMLQRMGYRVTGLSSSREALEVFKAQSGSVDLVITDQTMPDLTGVELAEEITRIRPDIPLILMTGFSETVSEKESELLGIDAFLMKPVDTQTMAATIRRVLDRKKETHG